MTRWASFAVASGCILLSVWGCVLLAHLLRPVVLVPKDTPLLFAGCRTDSSGTPRLVLLEVRLDR